MNDSGGRIWLTLLQVQRTSSSIEKIKMLKARRWDKMLTMVLYYAYNPFLRYHIRAVPDDVNGEGSGDISIKTWKLFTALSNRTLSGVGARRAIFEHIRSLTPRAGSVVKRILKKKLKCGVSVKTINAVHPGLIPDHGVMKAHDYDINHLTESFYVSPKLDGIRATYEQGKLLFGSGLEVKGCDHILAWLDKYGGTGWDGELTIPGCSDFDYTSGVIRSHAAKKPKVAFNVFDMMAQPDLPLITRLQAVNTFPKLGVCRPIPHVLVINHPDPIDRIDQLYENARQLGHEGIMIKDAYGVYERKRSWLWMKLKPFFDAEYECIGIFEGKGKHKGKCGGIIIKVGNVKVRVGGGMSDFQRESWWRWKDRIVGKWVTIKYMWKTKTGSLRHPEFKAIRRKP